MSLIEKELQRGWQLHQQHQLEQAEKIYRRALAESPDNANAWCYLGMVLHDQRHYQAAVQAYRQALRLRADFPIALNNLGNSLRYVGDLEEADACFQRAIELKPDYLNAYKNRGTLHVWSGGLEQGLKYYEKALQINPQEPELHRNLGVIYLLQGRFAEGWQEYRWRWKTGDLHRPFNHLPVWDGSPLADKSILLTVEQGLGDTLHFVRFANVLRRQGAATTVYCQPRLLALLQNSAEYVGSVFPNNLPLNPNTYDYQCSLLDVADILQVNENSMPAEVPYLSPSANLVSYWRQQIFSTPARVPIGIAWQGNPEHQADAFRSLPLKYFEALSNMPEVELISLQAGNGMEQLANWQGVQPVRLLGDAVDQSSGGFMDTAAILHHLDLLITSDTAIAHLGGAFNIPTWIVLGYVPDWRWLLNRDDSPWYPSVKLFRQSRMGDWQEVLQRVRQSVQQWIQQRS